MSKTSISILSIMLIALAVWASDASADQTYNNCIGCHGGFLDKPYVSLKDGQTWVDSLHNTHQNKVNKNCNFCHFGLTKTPVYLDKSNGVTGLQALGCAGCHGRAEDKNVAVPSGYGAGLRQHHWNAGVQDCFGCHFDANPANYKPVGENVLPPSYIPLAGYASLPTDSCNKDGKENYDGTALGLDNDGDGLYDGSDPDCQAAVSCIDNDKDGYGSNGAATCPNGTAVDCNDNNAAINPGAVEMCDGLDNNCNGQIDEGVKTTYYKDADGDGYGTSAASTQSCTQPAGYAANNTDCNDNDPKEHPNQTWYQDADGDGYSTGNMIVQCARPAGYKIASELSATSGDCNDSNAAIKPGVSDANCNGVDENCNGTADEGYVPTNTTCGVGVCASTGQLTCQAGKTVDTCTPKAPQTEGPYGSPTCTDKIDNDCNGSTDAADPKCVSGCVDKDGDGYGANGDPTCPKGTAIDCNDGSAAVNPGASDANCNGIDENCNGTADEGYVPTNTTCGVGACTSTGQLTCQSGKTVDSCVPNAPQTEGPLGDPTCSDLLDNDCDGLIDTSDSNCNPVACIDKDRDGYGANGSPACPKGTAIDCNDRKAKINPGAVEICDGADNNCDGQVDEGLTKTYYKDADHDGYGDPEITKLGCKKPSGYVIDDTDCDDSTSRVHPGAKEVCDAEDNNCNNETDEGVLKTFYKDVDGDGYGDQSVSMQTCTKPSGYVKDHTDCNDSNRKAHAVLNGVCGSQGGDTDDDDDDGDDDGDDWDNDPSHNFGMNCTSCHTPHNEITDCMTCHTTTGQLQKADD